MSCELLKWLIEILFLIVDHSCYVGVFPPKVISFKLLQENLQRSRMNSFWWKYKPWYWQTVFIYFIRSVTAYQEHCGLLQWESMTPIAMQIGLCACLLTCVWPPQHSGVNSSDTQVLPLYNVTEEESGEYICKASNYIGQANQSAWLTVTKPSKGNTLVRAGTTRLDRGTGCRADL